jgi:hypothetical protein
MRLNMPLDSCIVTACEQSWEEEFIQGTKNSSNCSGFAKAVANRLGVSFPKVGNADELVAYLDANKDWTSLASGKEAADKATTGTLVYAALKSGDHTPARSNGHIAIVISGKLYREKYPLCWGGSIGSAQSKGEKSTGEIWNNKDRDNVHFYGFNTTSCPTG